MREVFDHVVLAVVVVSTVLMAVNSPVTYPEGTTEARVLHGSFGHGDECAVQCGAHVRVAHACLARGRAVAHMTGTPRIFAVEKYESKYGSRSARTCGGRNGCRKIA